MRNSYPIDSYESTRSAALKKIKDAAKDSDNEVLEELTEELDPRKRQMRESNIQATRMIMDKCLEEYREGEYSFAQTKKMICGALTKLKD